MKIQKPAVPAADVPAEIKGAIKGESNPEAAGKATPAHKPDPGLSERRKMIRTLPVPDAVESERDTDWALFQALSDPEAAPKK